MPRSATLVCLWSTSRPLTGVAFAMLVTLVAALAGLWLDPRVVTGAPVWLKPAKFAASTAIYSLTLAWVFARMADSTPPGATGSVPPRRLARVVGWITAVVFLLEVGLIENRPH